MTRLRRFGRRSDGGIMVEAAIMTPLLASVLLVTFVFHDLFGFRNVRQKATYTVADMISRETEIITPVYLDNALELFNTITHGQANNSLRVSIIRYDANSDTYDVDWSEVRGRSDLTPLTQADVATAHSDLPTMSDEERLIVVDSFAVYKPKFHAGIGKIDIASRAFLRPRYAPNVVFGTTETAVMTQ